MTQHLDSPEAPPTRQIPRRGAAAPTRRSPVKWLSVLQLGRTAVEVVQATMFARFADQRETMASCPREFYTLDAPAARDLWLDFVADTGDGFDATFATARCVAGARGVEFVDAVEPGSSAAEVPADPERGLFPGRGPRADLLVLGGDEVYPVASAEDYAARLNSVLTAARSLAPASERPSAGHLEIIQPVLSGAPKPEPPLVALPGNHDWYDGLSSFRRNFCQSWVKGRDSDGAGPLPVSRLDADSVGGWGAFQSRSYFAVKLGPGWWLWGVDSQLDAPIDAEQLAYFRDARKALDPGDDVILCTATPSWLEAAGTERYFTTAETPLATLMWFIDRILGEDRARIRLLLTGDDHHFVHYAAAAPAADSFAPDLVTCGGGGAFLASTHHLPSTITLPWRPSEQNSPSTTYHQVSAYPDAEESKSLLRPSNNLGFLRAAWRNGWSLPALIGFVDFFLLYLPAVQRDNGRLAWLTLLTFVLLGAFALTGVKGRNLTARGVLLTSAGLALCHLPFHLAPALLLAWLGRQLGRSGPLIYAYHLLVFVVLSAVGTLVFVTYIRLADLRGYHRLEAFSGLRIEDYKCHLRLQIGADRVTVHVVAIDRVPPMKGQDTADAPPLRPRVIRRFTVAHSPPE